MPTVIAYHEIKDAKHWLSSPKREEFFGPLGVTNIRTFVDPQRPTRAAVLMDVPGADAMDHDGVLPETLVVLLEASGDPS